MIFLTLGTQLPFDRLVEAVDIVAADLTEDIFGQIGKSTYIPRNFSHTDTLNPVDFRAKFEAARVVIGHAGIGTVLSGFKSQKPLILMARRAALGEHRNDHQMATASQIRRFTGVYIAEGAEDLRDLLTRPDLEAMETQASPARAKLIENLRTEIFG